LRQGDTETQIIPVGSVAVRQGEPLHKPLFWTAIAGALTAAGPVLADPYTIDLLVASSTAKMLAGMALALSGLTVTASMFIVRKGLWRYLGVHATDRLRRFGSVGLILASLGIVAAARSGDDRVSIAQQLPEAWLWVAAAAGAVLLGAVVLRAAADVIWGRDSTWGQRIRYAGSGVAALGIAGILLVQASTLFRLDEKLASVHRLKEISSIQRIVQIFNR
jgi:hypothetical protein